MCGKRWVSDLNCSAQSGRNGFDVEYLNKSYALPRTGKDITVTTWDDNGKKTQKTLKWNGHGFSY